MFGQVCLLYAPKSGKDTTPNTTSTNTFIFNSPEVWFQDCACRWHYIAATLPQYLRLLTLHMGILGWLFVYTPEGIPPVTYQWLNIYCKERLILDTYWLNRIHKPKHHNNSNNNTNNTNSDKKYTNMSKKVLK